MPNTYQVRGIARIQQENYKGAIQDYEKALTFDPENTSLWHNLALSRMRDEDYAEAKADLDTLIRILCGGESRFGHFDTDCAPLYRCVSDAY